MDKMLVILEVVLNEMDHSATKHNTTTKKH